MNPCGYAGSFKSFRCLEQTPAIARLSVAAVRTEWQGQGYLLAAESKRDFRSLQQISFLARRADRLFAENVLSRAHMIQRSS